MTIVTRFAPSPTGHLHIGSARTALFNWLYAKHTKGTFLLRIEDTDRKRSTPEATNAIISGLQWLGLTWDEPIVYQSSRIQRHQEVAHELLASGKAYKCYCSQEELEAMRKEAKETGRPVTYNGYWRDRTNAEAPHDHPVIRIKTPLTGETIINDHVQGKVVVPNTQIDDFILLRADGTPTYMLASVVDDIDMNITHVIRGDDHLNNAARHMALYQALGKQEPTYAHIPLIHGSDGKKLSKRHGAISVKEYHTFGILPQAMRNYLMRLGWSHQNQEIISTQEAINWFDVADIRKAPARFDNDIMTNINAHYIRNTDAQTLTELILPLMKDHAIAQEQLKERVLISIDAIKQRANTLVKVAENSEYLNTTLPLTYTPKAQKTLNDDALERLIRLYEILKNTPWSNESLKNTLKTFINIEQVPMGKVLQPLRSALTGGMASPEIEVIMMGLGKEETIARLKVIF